MKWLVGLVLVAFFSNAASAQTGKSPDWHSLQLPEYYNENLKKIEAENTELIVDSFIKYFWKKPVGTPLDYTQISVVQTDKKGITILSKGSRRYSKVCTKGYIRSKQLIFFNAAATRTLNGRHADNYQFSMLKNVDDGAGNCRPIPDVSPAEIASTTGHYIPSRTAQAIHYMLKQKGVGLGHCGIRQRQGAIPNLKKLVVIDCYLESHGFNKKQSATMANIYPTVSIATYGNHFLGLSVYDATYSDSDVGKTREEIYAEYRTDAQKKQQNSDYLKQYLSLTRANKAKLNTAYFQHLDRLPDAPHFKSFTPEDISNLVVVDANLEGATFPVAQMSTSRKNALIANYRSVSDRYYEHLISSDNRKRFDALINRHTPYSEKLRRATIGVGPNEAQILAKAYARAVKWFGKSRHHSAYWQKRIRKERMAAKAKFYSDLALSLGSQRAYEDRAKSIIPKFSSGAKTSSAYQNYVVYQTEAIRLYKQNNPNDALFKIHSYENLRESEIENAQRNLHLLISRALVNQADVLQGPDSPHYTRSVADRKRDALIAPAYPNAAYRCGEIFKGLEDAKFGENVLRPFLVQCIRAAPNNQILVYHFNSYIKKKYFSLEGVVKYSDHVDVMAIAEKKFVAFGQTKNAANMRTWMASNERKIAVSGDRWRSEASVEFAERRRKKRKSDAETAKMWADREAEKRAEKARNAAANRRVRERMARVEAETRGSQSTGQMISNAMGNIIRNQPTIAQIERDANARIAASRRQALAQQRAERQRTAVAAQTQRDQAANRARQQRAAQQRLAQQRIAANDAARKQAANQRAAQQRAANQRIARTPAAVQNTRTPSNRNSPDKLLVFPKGVGWQPGMVSGNQAADGILVQLKITSACFNEKDCAKIRVVTRVENVSGLKWCGAAATAENPPTGSQIAFNVGPSKTHTDETYLAKGVAPIYVLIQKRSC